MSRRPKQTVAVEIERRLAREILNGKRAPGSQLPPVRALAVDYDVTVPTIQRVLERLESMHLVTVRHGSGVTVNDPMTSGDLSLLPLWFDALVGEPDRVAEMLGEFLELRRILATHLAKTARDRLASASSDLAERAQAALTASSVLEIADADLAFTRSFVGASQNFAVGTIFRTTERLIREVPHVADALYADKAYYRQTLKLAIEAVIEPSAEKSAAKLGSALLAWDTRTVKRFRRLLKS